MVEFFDKESKISLALYNTRELYPQYSIYKHGASTVSNSKVSTRDFPGGPVVKTLPSSAGGAGLNPHQGTKIPHALWTKKQNVKKKQYCNKFDRDFEKKKYPQNIVLH